jgi:iron-sulfur cluster repair protein YtfE (RIC family)
MADQWQSTVTAPLRAEHRELIPHVEQLRAVADSIGWAPVDALRSNIEIAYGFLMHHLLPHAQAEERALYPAVARVLGSPRATDTMRRDHAEIGRLARELDVLRAGIGGAVLEPSLERDLRWVLYGLYALVRVHFAKEEEVYLPILDAALTAEEGRAMYEAMERAASETRALLE